MKACWQHTFRNYVFMRWPWLRWLVRLSWARTQHFLDRNAEANPQMVEGLNAPAAAQVRKHVRIPVICTGGFQTADGILRVLENGSCDAVSIARPLLANPDLPKLLQEGWPGPKDPPCSYCNKCLLNVLEHPLGCYDERRFHPVRRPELRENDGGGHGSVYRQDSPGMALSDASSTSSALTAMASLPSSALSCD
jgi:2,4-dienoyl-CoA reductase (NADPH2)